MTSLLYALTLTNKLVIDPSILKGCQFENTLKLDRVLRITWVDVDLSPDADLSSSYLSGIKLNRGPWPVAQDHTNLDCNPEHFQTVAPGGYWNIEYFMCRVSCLTPRFICGATKIVLLVNPAGNCSRNANFCLCLSNIDREHELVSLVLNLNAYIYN